MSGEETKKEDIAYYLGSHLGSDLDYISEGRIDKRETSKINHLESIVFAYMMQIPKYRGGNAANKMVWDLLSLKMSEEGWRANQMVRTIGSLTGGRDIEIAKKPGIIGRIRNPDWKEKAEREGKIVVE